MTRVRRILHGGSAGNEHLTAVIAAVLLVLLAIEGATLLNVQSVLTVHAFVGILLIPVIGLKLAATGWRFMRYCLGGEEYVRRGPPPIVLRALVAPVLTLSTVVLFGTGVALLVLDRTSGPLVGLHKASFVVWFGAAAVHVLAHAGKLARALRQRVPGIALRAGAVTGAVLIGTVLATATLPSADRLQDDMSAQIGLDSG